tara:strand:- start:90 stop:347 length:258 start_codon:yes stop_codon:yes gene_type:complete
MQWILNKKEDNDRFGGRILKNKETRGRKLVVDKLIKYCPVCERTYERVNMGNYNTKYMFYKKGQIPSYGKEKILCETCEVRNEQI